MTETEWLASEDFIALTQFLTTDRKRLLFSCACCRRVWEHLDEEFDRRVVEAAELIADGRATAVEHELAQKSEADFPRAWTATFLSAIFHPKHFRTAALIQMFVGSLQVRNTPEQEALAEDAERRSQVAILRDIIGNPFCPVTCSSEWRTDTALAISAQMYDSRDFSPMPILADALQDAGCDNADVLNHCRSPGPHVRGCWVVDLVLGKS